MWALMVSLAVVLAAGALSAIGGGDGGSTVIVAGAASVGVEGLPDEPIVTTTTTLAPTTSVVPTSVRPTTTTTRRPPATTTTTSTRPSVPTSALPATTVATTPLPSRWSGTNGPLSASVRVEPAAPVAGQPVTFTITVAPGVACCLAALVEFGDEGDTQTSPLDHAVLVSQACASHNPASGARAHTYAEAGAYRGTVRVVGLECLAEPDVNGVPTGAMFLVEIPICVGVGPGAEARACAR